MGIDLAKTLLQGGWLVTPVKHWHARTVINNSPFYITTNKIPAFAEDDENVRRRIAIFNTKSLAETGPGIDRWMFDTEIKKYQQWIETESLWYNRPGSNDRTRTDTRGVGLFDVRAVKDIPQVDLQDHASFPTVQRKFRRRSG